MRINRRNFLKYSGAAGFVLATSPTWTGDRTLKGLIYYASIDPRNPDNFTKPLRLPGNEGVLGILQVPAETFRMDARQEPLEVIPGATTNFLVYAVDHQGKHYVNPIIKLTRGQVVQAQLINGLDEKTIVHWHGLSVPWWADGHPSYVIDPGYSYDYNFEVRNRGGTYWYHPHPDMRTGSQTYMGLASLFTMEDDDELALRDALDLNLGETDIPLMLQDKQFDAQGNLVYSMDPAGFLGNVVLGNLSVTPYLNVETRIYRFRLLNSSNARVYRLAFVKDDVQLPFAIIGTDGGLLERPQEAREVFLSSAERVDVLLDLKNMRVGDVIFFRSLAFDPSAPMAPEPLQNLGIGEPLEQGDAFYVLKLVVANQINYDRSTPAVLSSIEPINVSEAQTRTLPLYGHPGSFSINGWVFMMDEYPVTANRDTTEIWEITNYAGPLPHPMHLHAFQFQVLERLNSPLGIRRLAVDDQGRLPTDLGWKDTVLVWVNETVRIAIDFSLPFAGEQIYLFHCHNLEHEDMGMMINYKVV